jgi:acetyltransferase-like isoleucine patch superfamily enzyme
MNANRAFIVGTGRRIAPFDDPVGDAMIDNEPLRSVQRRALESAGFQVQHVARREDIPAEHYPCVLAGDDLYFSEQALLEFVSECRRRAISGQCAISKDTAFARIATPYQDEESNAAERFPLFYLEAPGRALIVVPIDIREQPLPFYIPEHMRRGCTIALPASVRPLIQIHIAADILFANVICTHRRFAEAIGNPLKRAMLAMRARSSQPARILACMNRVGPGCDIHPTARLEGAIIGSRVRIGANAVVRMSTIGDGCEIGDGSVVKHSVLGPGCVLFDDLTVGFAVCYENTFLIHGPYHLSLFGRSTAVFATILEDFRVDGLPIRLERYGRLVSYPFPFMGCFIGHRTRVAGGCILAPGRTIPNDLVILPSPDNVLARIPSGAPSATPLFIRYGTLEQATQPHSTVLQETLS